MTFDWRKEFERQHGRLPGRSLGSHDPGGTAVPGHGNDAAEGVDDTSGKSAAAGAPTASESSKIAPVTNPAPLDVATPAISPRVPARVAAVARLAAARPVAPPKAGARDGRPCRKGAAKVFPRAADSVLDLLGAGDLAHLDVMAKDSGKSREAFAADLLGDVIADDAEAHEGRAG